jgi:hypothetical protein
MIGPFLLHGMAATAGCHRASDGHGTTQHRETLSRMMSASRAIDKGSLTHEFPPCLPSPANKRGRKRTIVQQAPAGATATDSLLSFESDHADELLLHAGKVAKQAANAAPRKQTRGQVSPPARSVDHICHESHRVLHIRFAPDPSCKTWAARHRSFLAEQRQATGLLRAVLDAAQRYEGCVTGLIGFNFPATFMPTLRDPTICYVIAYLIGDEPHRRHEERHALYYMDAAHRGAVQIAFGKQRAKNAALRRMGYAPDLWADEFAAYWPRLVSSARRLTPEQCILCDADSPELSKYVNIVAV